MKRFKPFTQSCLKKGKWCEYRDNKMRTYATINGRWVSLKEKYGRMDASVLAGGDDHLFMETMEDYEALSEESCMYCNKRCKQYWTHEDSWVIHLCLPCLMGDKITILLERIIRRWRRQINGGNGGSSYSA